MSLSIAQVTVLAAQQIINPCDDRCMFAKGDDCDCECEGRNHQQGGRLTAEQRTILRTKAGRRIPVLTFNSSEWHFARQAAAMEAAGVARKDIAAEMRVSAPVIRRSLRSLAHTLDLIAAAQD